MKKVSFLINSLYSGGAEKILSDIVNNLDSKKFNIEVFTIEKDKFYSLNKNVKYRPLSNLRVTSNKILKLILFPFILLKLFFKLNKKDTLVTFMEVSNFFGLLLKPLLRFKLIISVHINPSIQYQNGLFSKITKYLIKKLYNKADKVVVVSKEIELELIKNFGIKKEKIEVIYNFISTKEIKEKLNQTLPKKDLKYFPKDKFNLITIGRLSEQKGHKYIIQSLKKVVEKHPKLNLNIIGDGPYKDDLANLIKKHSLENNVHLLGTRKNVFPYLKKSDSFIFPSLWEGFGIVLIEAQAAGLSIISSNCHSGPREILEPKISLNNKLNDFQKAQFGYLLKPFLKSKDNKKQIEFWSNSLIEILNNKEKLKEYSKLSKQRSKDFDVKKIINEWEEVISK